MHVQFVWLLLYRIGSLQDIDYADVITRAWLDELLLTRLLSENFGQRGLLDGNMHLLKVMILSSNWLEQAFENANAAFDALLQNSDVQQFLQVNRYQGTLYFNKENFEKLLAASFTVSRLSGDNEKATQKQILELIERFVKSAEEAAYRVLQMQELLVPKQK